MPAIVSVESLGTDGINQCGLMTLSTIEVAHFRLFVSDLWASLTPLEPQSRFGDKLLEI